MVPANNEDIGVDASEAVDGAVENSTSDAPVVADESSVGRQEVKEKGRKRRRGADEEEENLTPAAKKFGLDDQSLNSLRRSPRLTAKLDEAWKSALVAPGTGKKKRVRK